MGPLKVPVPVGSNPTPSAQVLLERACWKGIQARLGLWWALRPVRVRISPPAPTLAIFENLTPYVTNNSLPYVANKQTSPSRCMRLI